MNVAGQFAPYTPVVDNDSKAAGMPLLQVRDFLGRQWRLIALMTGLAIIVGVAYLAVTPARFTAQADMIIDTKRVTWTQSELATENRNVEDAAVDSEIETTKSEKVALSVIRRLHLEDDPEFAGAGRGLKRVALELGLLGSARSVTGIAPAGLWPEPLVPKAAIAHRLARSMLPAAGWAVTTRPGRSSSTGCLATPVRSAA